MKNVSANIVFTLTAETGEQLHKSELQYNGMDEQQVLMLEKHMLNALNAMNGEAAGFAANKGKVGK